MRFFSSVSFPTISGQVHVAEAPALPHNVSVDALRVLAVSTNGFRSGVNQSAVRAARGVSNNFHVL